MSQDRENSFEFEGEVVEPLPAFQIQQSGYMKGKLTVRWLKRYQKDGQWIEKPTDVPFELFGKPAEKAEAMNLQAGTLVRIAFELDSFKGFAQLRPWRVDLRTNQNPGKGPEKAQEEQIPHSDPETLDDADIPF